MRAPPSHMRFHTASTGLSGSTRSKGLRPGRVDGLTFGRRIGIHDLDRGSARLRIEGFIGHKQCRPRRQYSIYAGRELGWHFDSGNRVRIYLRTLFSEVPGHADSQPTKFGWIRNVGIGHAARAFAEHQCVIDERRIPGDGQSRSADLYPVAIHDDEPTSLTEYDADRPAGRQFGLPTFILFGRKSVGFDRLAADKLHRGEVPRMRDLLWRSLLGANDYRHAVRRDVEEALGELAWQVNATVRFRITRQSPGMQCNAPPRESLHVWHGRTVIDSRSMLFLLLQHRENSGRSRVTRTAGADGSSPDQDPVAINVRTLFGDADDHNHRTRGHSFAHPQKLAFLQLINGRVDRYRGLCTPKRNRIG